FDDSDSETARLAAGSGAMELQGDLEVYDGYIRSYDMVNQRIAGMSEGSVWFYGGTSSWGVISIDPDGDTYLRIHAPSTDGTKWENNTFSLVGYKDASNPGAGYWY